MSSRIREKTIQKIARLTPPVDAPPVPVADISASYAEDVFHLGVIQQMLSKPSYAKLLETIQGGAPLAPEVADDVAAAMRQWATARGATHYTHWFQPLTGATAEKHDALLEPDEELKLMVKFSGKNLIVGEPDASSFPSGGLRSTFEARGYTAWDPSSPAFLRRVGRTVTLCIPTAFCSYTGEALDKKTPLLRSIQALSRSVSRMMKHFPGDCGASAAVQVNLGPEQEYFLIDRQFYFARPDLVQTGRTLFGAAPPKHQQLEDHYFGTIKPRILAFMRDVELELWRLGIPAKTRHNEVAPAQFEIAPLFEELNLAVDHNMLVMEVLRQTAEEHGLVCLLHEKPFAGINGSGKHNNWSITYGGRNLLDPGSDPCQNAVFLTTLCAVIRAIDLHGDLLRVATACAGNDHRLGANEAPPAILSVFLGEQLTEVIGQIETGAAKKARGSEMLAIGVDKLPPLPKDSTDRNRTSPFAFTGNKFEFRAPGSSQSCAGANMVINTIVAESMDKMSDEIEKFDSAKDFNTQLQALLQRIIKKHKRIIFNGNGYDEAWVEEAARRGLPNLRTTPEALEPFRAPESIALFERYGVFSGVEVHSRYEVFMSEYRRKVRIEAELSALMANTVFLPAAIRQLRDLEALLDRPFAGKALQKRAETLGRLLEEVSACAETLSAALADESDDAAVLAAMGDLRTKVDAMELLVADEYWPLPKYREMLFIH